MSVLKDEKLTSEWVSEQFLNGTKLTKKQTYMKTEACKLYSVVFWIFLPNVVKIDPYNFEVYRFKVCAFFLRYSVVVIASSNHSTHRQTSAMNNLRDYWRFICSGAEIAAHCDYLFKLCLPSHISLFQQPLFGFISVSWWSPIQLWRHLLWSHRS